MSHLVSEYSQVGGSIKTQPHSEVKMTQVDVEDSWEDILLPTTQQYGVGQTVIFEATQTSQYTDLSKSYVRITGNWTALAVPITNGGSLAGGAVDATDYSTAVVNFPSSLFTNVQLYMNNTTVSPNRGGDAWISFVDRLLLGRKGASENCMQTGLSLSQNAGQVVLGVQQDFDLGSSLDQLDTAFMAWQGANITPSLFAVPTNINTGADMRSFRIINETQLNGAGTGASEYLYQPSLGCWKIDKYIPDRVGLKLYLTVQDPSFYTQTNQLFYNGAVANNYFPRWQFVISKMELVMHRLKLHKSVVEQNSMAMIERPWVASTYQMVYSRQTFNVNQLGGNTSMDLTGVYVGPTPKFVLVGIQDQQSALTGTSVNPYTVPPPVILNPYYMSEITRGVDPKDSYANQIFILVNGKQYPIQRPYQPSSQLGHIRDYRALCEITKDAFPNVSSPLITYAQYGLDYTWYAFLIDPIENDLDTFSATEDVNIEVHGTFAPSNSPAQVAVAHIICYVPSVLYIDGARECALKSKSGVPIEFQ